MLFLCYPKCSTCQKAKKWLDNQGIEYTERHIVEENPMYEELKNWYQKSELPLKRFFNTSGMFYKEMKLKDKLPEMSEEEQLKLLATNGMLVKRPLLVTEDKVLTGFKEAEWEKMMQGKLGGSDCRVYTNILSKSPAYTVKTVSSGDFFLKDYIEERAVEIAHYIIENRATVRQTAKKFGVSKSTVHMEVTIQNGSFG